MRDRIVTLIIVLIGALSSITQGVIIGQVVNQDGTSLYGVVVYDITNTKLEILNNETALTAHVPRAITDHNGKFTLKSDSPRPLLMTRSLDGQFALFSPGQSAAETLILTILKPSTLTGTLMEGPFSVPDTDVTLTFATYSRNLSYTCSAKTDAQGQFDFNNLMPGTYTVQVIKEIPALGCIAGVVTKQKNIVIKPGETACIQLGGTDLPFLTGAVSTEQNKPLHGVWVQLLPENENTENETKIWADVTDPNGRYTIYDLPAGHYRVRCLRRLAKNTPGRTLRRDLDVEIKRPPRWPGMADGQFKDNYNKLDVTIDMEPFMPLRVGQDAPNIQTQTADDRPWHLKEHRDKIVVIHFYTTGNKLCRANFDGFEKVYTTLKPKVEVLGICLDESFGGFETLIHEKAPRHQQAYEGPQSQIAADLRITDLPASVVIDREGKIVQIDIFGATLQKFIQDNLLSK